MKLSILLFVLLFMFGCVRSSTPIVEKITVKTLSKNTQSWNKSDLPTYPKGRPEITILKVIIPPKTKISLHKHPIISAGVIIKGHLTIHTDTQELIHLKSGDSMIEVVNRWHYGENSSNDVTEIIVFYAGEKGKMITIKK